MKIWLTRHGQTELNRMKLMQGLTDEPLNARGIRQAEEMHTRVGDVKFDAVFASPLCRARQTAAIISGLSEEQIRIDPRIIEVDFGRYEKQPYNKMGPAMSLFWLAPEFFPAPSSVETVRSMVERSQSFVTEIKDMPYENILVVCHGGIIRALRGCLEGSKNGIRWRPRPKNCEISVYRSVPGGFCLAETSVPLKPES